MLYRRNHGRHIGRLEFLCGAVGAAPSAAVGPPPGTAADHQPGRQGRPARRHGAGFGPGGPSRLFRCSSGDVRPCRREHDRGRAAQIPHRAAASPARRAPEKPKRGEPQKLLLDDAQIASLRTRLQLTPTQEEFWPAVEVTLRNVIRQHARSRKPHSNGAPQIDVNSPEVQQLISAAVPLIMRLSEEQKREVRQLAQDHRAGNRRRADLRHDPEVGTGFPKIMPTRKLPPAPPV